MTKDSDEKPFTFPHPPPTQSSSLLSWANRSSSAVQTATAEQKEYYGQKGFAFSCLWIGKPRVLSVRDIGPGISRFAERERERWEIFLLVSAEEEKGSFLAQKSRIFLLSLSAASCAARRRDITLNCRKFPLLFSRTILAPQSHSLLGKRVFIFDNYTGGKEKRVGGERDQI